MEKRAKEYHEEFVKLERSKYPPQGWNVRFHAPGHCLLDSGVRIAVDGEDKN